MTISTLIENARELGYRQGYQEGFAQGTQQMVNQYESDDFKRRLLSKGLQAGAQAGLQAVIEEADQERRKLQERMHGLEEALRYYGAIVVEGEKLNEVETVKRVSEGQTLLPYGEVCIVSYKVTVKYGPRFEDHHVYGNRDGHICYPGSKEDFVNEVGSRIDALMYRAPTREDIKGPTIYGIGELKMEDIVYKAGLALAQYYWLPALHEKYRSERKRIFEEHVWPNVDQNEHSWDVALNLFGKKIENSFQAMKQRDPDSRGGTPPPPARNKA